MTEGVPAGLLTLADIEAARTVIDGVVRVTPMERSRPLSAVLGDHPAWLKLENLQRAGSYKVRGAYLRISRLSDAERARGVVAASAGNHAQGVALAAGLLGARSTVFMPHGAPLPKVTATRGYGADIEFAGATVDDALVAAREFADRTGAILIHPFDHRDIIAGQGTVGLEIVEQCPEVENVVVGIGGGGLVSGLAVAVKARKPGVRIIGVQAAGAAAFPPSLAAGHPLKLLEMRTIADGIAVGCPGDLTYAHVEQLVDEIVTVTDEDISQALLTVLERHKLVVEPAGSVSVAALLSGAAKVDGPTVAVLSGGNIDPMLLLRVIEHGLSAAGRFQRLAVRCADQPGSLAQLLLCVSDQQANVVDVVHSRQNPSLNFGEVEVLLSVETRGPDHSATLVAALRAADYRVTTVAG